MLELSAIERSRMHVAVQDALRAKDISQTSEESAKWAYAQLVSGADDSRRANFAMHEVLRLADAIGIHLISSGIEPPFSFKLSNVASLVGGDIATARTALRLLGEIPTDNGWRTGSAEERPSNVLLPASVLVDQIMAELEEAKSFASAA